MSKRGPIEEYYRHEIEDRVLLEGFGKGSFVLYELFDTGTPHVVRLYRGQYKTKKEAQRAVRTRKYATGPVAEKVAKQLRGQ